MRNHKSTLLILAKYINQEILIDELFRAKDLTQDTILSKYRKKKRIIKIKIIITKIFYSIIFGILPVIPLFTYFEIQNQFINQGLDLRIIIFGGSLLYSFFFVMEFLNVMFMGMIEISLILSKNLFFWLETLPISAKRLKKLKLLTIFHSFDIPILVITFAFPIVIFLGTLNIVAFFVCLALSILQVIFAFSVLILLGNVLNKSLDLNLIGSRKTLIIRLFNIFGFVVVFFGSLMFVQWAISSIDIFFTFPMVQEHPAILNVILCTIPYPFSSSYLISFVATTNQIQFYYWIGLISGLGLFAIFDWWISKRALIIMDKSISSNIEKVKKIQEKKSSKIYIRIKKPISAYFIKDFKIITRNLKAFLSVITPLIISFVFYYTFNFTVLGAQTPFTTDMFYNWSVILAFQPVICGMLIYNLINIEGSGESILNSLPIIPKDQAKSKLLYFLIIQTISIISPYLIYIFEPNFIELFISILISLPFSWIILISMLELYIYSFGRKKYKYVLEPVKPKNKFSKWAFIYLTEYCFYMFIVSLGMVLNYKRELFYLINFIVDIIVCFGIIFLIFKTMFVPMLKPKLKIEKKKKLVKTYFELVPEIKLVMEQSIGTKPYQTEHTLRKAKILTITKSNFIIKHPWLSILITLIFNFVFVLCINFYIISLNELLSGRFYERIFWFCLMPISILIFIRIKYIPKPTYKKLNVSYQIFYYIISGIIGAIIIIFFHMFCVFTFSWPYPYPLASIYYIINYLNLDLFGFFTILIFALWNEILFRGIILPILTSKFKKLIAFSLSLWIFIIYYFYGFFLYMSYGITLGQLLLALLINLSYMLIINGFLSFLYIWQKNIYPGLIVHSLNMLAGILPYFYFGIYFFFPNFM
ncbi:MAG: type II CAAX prenyl endopeptidase Rce1 family protein [Candidatus Thorarchaeota archaeon]